VRHLDAELGKADGKLVAVEAPIAVGVEPREDLSRQGADVRTRFDVAAAGCETDEEQAE